MRTLARIFAFLCGLYVTAAIAAYQPSAVVQVPTVAALQAGDFTNTQYINIANYATAGDGGGGTFVPIGQGCTPDNGVTFRDNAGQGNHSLDNCFLRQFKGAVQLPWYGVTDARNCFTNMSACGADTALTAATVAAPLYGNGIVTTAGRPIVLTSTLTMDFTIPASVTLTCDTPPGGLRAQSSTSNLKMYNQPGTIFVTPSFSIASNDNSVFKGCIVLPSWYVPSTTATYTIPATTLRDIIGINRAFKGTAAKCNGEACQIQNIVSLGFDVGIQASGPRANISDNISQNNDDIWFTSEGGSAQVNHNEEIIFTNRNYAFRVFDYPITAIATDGSDGIKITVDPTTIAGGMQIVAGDTLLISGVQYLLQSATRNSAHGDVGNSSSEVDNIMIVGNGTPPVGSTVADNSGCIPANTTILTFTLDDNQITYTMTMSANATCTKNGDLLSFIDTAIGPASTNGAKVVDHVSGNDIFLKGASLAGPTFPASTWTSGFPVVKVYDPAATNVIAGQYLCASGTAPFCTAPSGWIAGTLSSSNINALGMGTGTITVSGSQTGWAASGVFKVDSEIIAYSVINSTSLNITRRGLGGTTAAAHSNPGTLTTTAPLVTGVAKTEGRITFAVNAQSTGSGTVQFANDPNVVGTAMGQAEITTGYIPYSANLSAGNIYGSAIVSPATGTSGGSTLVLGDNANWQHVYEGESVVDLTTGSRIPTGTTVDQTPSANSIHLSQALASNVSGDLIGFGTDGSCGYPGAASLGAKQWWLGNCPGQAFVLGGYGAAAKVVQGVRLYSNHNVGHRNGLRTINAPATTLWGSILNSSGKPDGYDDSRAAVWISSTSQKSSILGSRATTIIVDSTVGVSDDIAIGETQVADNVVFAGGSVNYMAAKYSSVGAFPDVLVTSDATSVSIAGAQMQAYQLIADNSATLANIHCSSDSAFLNPICTALGNNNALSMLNFGGVPDWTTDNTNAYSALVAAAVAANVHVIQLDPNPAGSGYYIPSMTVPANMTVLCPSGGLVQPQTGRGGLVGTVDYTHYPNAIVTNGIVTSGAGAQIVGCNVVNTAVASVVPTTTQGLFTQAAAETGIGFSCVDDCMFKHGAIIGFGTGIKLSGIRSADLEDIAIDSTIGIDVPFQRGGGKVTMDSINIQSWLTDLTAFSDIRLAVTGFADSAGAIQYTLASSCGTGNCPANGNRVCILSGASAQSADGCWTVSGVTATTGVLSGTTSALLLSGAGVGKTGTIALGSPEISGLPNVTQLQPGQVVTGAGIPAGATIQAVWAAAKKVYLDPAHLPTASATETITFQDGPTDLSCSTLDITTPIQAAGSGYVAGETLVVSGGTLGPTGLRCQIIINTVDGSGAVTGAQVDPDNTGDYTVFPVNPVSVTGGSGTGATFNLTAPGGQLQLWPSNRTGAAMQFRKTADIIGTKIVGLNHATCLIFNSGAANITFPGVQCDAENASQDYMQQGVVFNGTAQNINIDGCVIHYFAGSIVDNTVTSANTAPNSANGCTIGGPNGSSGLRSIVFEIDSPLGSAKKSAISLIDVHGWSTSSAFISKDVRSVNLSGDLGATVVYADNATTVVSGNLISMNSGPVTSGLYNKSFAVFPNRLQVGLSGFVNPTSTPWQLFNSDCGKVLTLGSVGADTTFLMPSVPAAGCRFTPTPTASFAIWLDPNGNDIITRDGSYTSPFKINAASGQPIASFSWNTAHWYPDGGAPSTVTGENLANGQVRKQGDVYLSLVGGTSGAGSIAQLCPFGGNGGLTINGTVERIPNSCIFAPDTAATGASRLNFLYAIRNNITVSTAVAAAGLVRVTLSSISSLQNGDTLCLRNFTVGTTEANGCWIVSNVGASGNSADLVGSAFVNTYVSGGAGYYLAITLANSTNTHTTLNGVEVNSLNNAQTLVGLAWLDASTHLQDTLTKRDTLSWYNRQPKKMLVALGANTATTTSTTFKTPTTTAVEGEFVVGGPPTAPGTVPIPAVPWSITAGASATGLASTAQIGACFGTSALGTNASCGSTVETEIASETQAVATDVQSYSLSGQTVILTEGRNYADIVVNVSTGTLTLAPSATFLDVYLQQ